MLERSSKRSLQPRSVATLPAAQQTADILATVLQYLQQQVGTHLAVELFPENPQGYRLNHPQGAVLVAFTGSSFGASQALDTVLQPREITLALTLVFRQLNASSAGMQGLIAWLDILRALLVGFTPAHCTMPLAAMDENFIGQVSGLWQYAQKYQTRSLQISTFEPELGTALKPPLFAGAVPGGQDPP